VRQAPPAAPGAAPDAARRAAARRGSQEPLGPAQEYHPSVARPASRPSADAETLRAYLRQDRQDSTALDRGRTALGAGIRSATSRPPELVEANLRFVVSYAKAVPGLGVRSWT